MAGSGDDPERQVLGRDLRGSCPLIPLSPMAATRFISVIHRFATVSESRLGNFKQPSLPPMTEMALTGCRHCSASGTLSFGFVDHVIHAGDQLLQIVHVRHFTCKFIRVGVAFQEPGGIILQGNNRVRQIV